MDSLRVDPGAGGEQDLDKVETVEARGEVERTVEVAAAFDQQIDAGAVDAELVTQRAPEHVRFRYLAEQRASGPNLGMHQPGVCVEQVLERAASPARIAASAAATGSGAGVLDATRRIRHGVPRRVPPGGESVFSCDHQSRVGDRGSLAEGDVDERGEARYVRTQPAPCPRVATVQLA